jgi:hypothetical protein
MVKYEDVNTTESNKKDKGGDEERGDEQQQNNPSCCASQCCYLTQDIVATVFLYFMSASFLTGSLFVHPRSYYTTVKEPLSFFFIGSLCYLTTAILDAVKRRSLGAREISMTSFSAVGGALWLIGSSFLFSKIINIKVWGSLWIIGCIFNLVSITYDLIIICMKEKKPLFRTISLGLSWLANIILAGGAIQILKELSSLTVCELGSAANGLASGAVILIFHSIFHTLSFTLKRITFSINRDSS